jgi:hypothetical protein
LSAREDLYAQLPRLQTAPHAITSPPTDAYNCVAWIERDQDQWWEPGFTWPADVPPPRGDDDLDSYVALFRHWGFEVCGDGSLEAGFLKIAIYAVDQRFQHVAKQLPSGRWSSKLGLSFDVLHDDLDSLYDAPLFERATATIFMKRPYDGVDQFYVEEPRVIIP